MGQSEAKMWHCVYKNEAESLRAVLRDSPKEFAHRRLVTNPVEGPIGNITPLHVACHYGFADVARVLVEAGADPHACIFSTAGEETPVTCVDVARARGNVHLFPILNSKAVVSPNNSPKPPSASSLFPTPSSMPATNPYLTPAAPSMGNPVAATATPVSPQMGRHSPQMGRVGASSYTAPPPPSGPVFAPTNPYQGQAAHHTIYQFQQQQQQQQPQPPQHFGGFAQMPMPVQQPYYHQSQPLMQPSQQPYYGSQPQAWQYHQQAPPHAALPNHWDINRADLEMGKELGRGAFGIVYKGRWRFTDVAIKVIQGTPSPADMRTFQDETQLMMNLRPHKNVVQLRGVCPNPLCVVIDFVDGGSLEARLADKTKPVGWPKVFQWSQGIVAGLLHLHMEKIVHRDLAARNVLLDAVDNPLISDFGLSAVGRSRPGDSNNSIQEMGFFRGPYKWMGPESLAHNQFSVKSDVWSLGCTLWEILSRHPPFEKLTIYEVKERVVRDRLRLPIAAKWPEMWKNLLAACWRTDPAMRPDCATVAVWLEQMGKDYNSNPTSYGPDPALSAEEMDAIAAVPTPPASATTATPPASTGSSNVPTLNAPTATGTTAVSVPNLIVPVPGQANAATADASTDEVVARFNALKASSGSTPLRTSTSVAPNAPLSASTTSASAKQEPVAPSATPPPADSSNFL